MEARSLLLICGILTASHCAKIGFLVSSTDSYYTELQDIVQFGMEDSSNQLVLEEYNSTMSEIVEACCRLVESGVAVVVTKATSADTVIQAEYLTPLKIPLIAVSATDPYLLDQEYLLKMSPSDLYQSHAIFDLVKYYEWLRPSILASSDTYGLHGLLEFQQLIVQEDFYSFDNVLFFHSSDNGSAEISNQLIELFNTLSRVIVLNCEASLAKEVLKAAYINFMTDYGYVWIVTDGITSQPYVLADDDTGSLYSYYEGLLGTRPAIDKGTNYQTFKDSYTANSSHTVDELTSYTLLAYDAVGLADEVLESLSVSQNIECSSDEGWSSGSEVLSALLSATYTGVTGEVNFTDTGETTKIVYDIVNFRDDTFQSVGTWQWYEDTSHLKIRGYVKWLGGLEDADTPSSIATQLTGFHLRLGILAAAPYSYFATEWCEDNDCWTGPCAAIISRLSDDLGFTYEFVVPEDGKWGGVNHTTGEWNGIIRDVMDGRIDMGAVFMSAIGARQLVVDFSFSFMNSYVTACVKSEGSAGNTFFFLTPLSVGVWMAVIVTTVFTSILIWASSKFSPYGKSGAKVHAMQTCPCDECKARLEEVQTNNCTFEETKEFDCLIEAVEDDDRSLDVSWHNSSWLIAAGLLGQGAEALPQCLSSRFTLLVWWFFIMLVNAIYTANLTAFITINSADSHFGSVLDLLDQNEYAWGLVGSTATETLLEGHTDPRYDELVHYGSELKSMAEGVDKVREGYFVYIGEPGPIKYYLGGDCDVKSVGEPFMSFEYALPFPKGSAYKDLIDIQIVKYREEGYIDSVWAEWATRKECSTELGETVTMSLSMLAGMFHILFMGVGVATLIIIGEVLYACVLDTRQCEAVSFVEALKRRLRLRKALCRGGEKRSNVEQEMSVSVTSSTKKYNLSTPEI